MGFGKQNLLWIFHPMAISGNLNDNGANYDFYGAVSVGGAINFNGRTDTYDKITFHSTLSGSIQHDEAEHEISRLRL